MQPFLFQRINTLALKREEKRDSWCAWNLILLIENNPRRLHSAFQPRILKLFCLYKIHSYKGAAKILVQQKSHQKVLRELLYAYSVHCKHHLWAEGF